MVKFRNSSLWGYVYSAPLIIIISIYMVYSFIYDIVNSLYDWNGISPVKEFIGLQNYSNLFSDPVFVTIIKNFFLFAFFTIFFQAFFGLILAILLKKNFLSRDLIKSIIFMPAVLSTVLIGNIFFRILEPNIGFLNTFLRSIGFDFMAKTWLADINLAIWVCIAISIWQWTGYSMTMYYAGLKAIPNELYESAMIDGAGIFQTFRSITLPMLQSTTYSLTILGVISVIKQFDLVFTLTKGGPANSTQMFSIYMYNVSFNLYKEGYACAIAVVIFTIALIITIIQLRMQKRSQIES